MQKTFLFCVLLFSIKSFSQNKLDVFFDFNKDVPNEASQVKMKQWVSDNKNVEVTRVLGYCDSVDNNSYNKDLAMRRVNSMVAFFNKNNIRIADKVELKSFGEDFKYSKIQSENRKVEVFYDLPKEKKKDEKVKQTTQITPEKNTEKIKEVKETKEEYEFEPIDVEELVAVEKSTLATKFEKANKGDLIRINNINFGLNSEKVINQSIPLLNELLQIMLDNPKMRIEIHGHICCNPNPLDTKLSYRRAIVIFKYLKDRAIPTNRLAYKGFGSNDPIYKVPERNEKERAANRRVEILIVDK